MSDGTGSALTWAGIITAVTALAGTFLPYLKRKDDLGARVMDEREKMRANLDTRVLAEMNRQDEKIARLEKRIADLEGQGQRREAELEAEIRRVEQDRDRGWYLARRWENRCGAVWHRLSNKIQMLNGFIRAGTIPGPEIKMDRPLPKLEDIDEDES